MPGDADPALAYNEISTPALITAYDGLTTLRRSGDAAGLTLVPDLARALPRPANGGTSYTFMLRRGIRYSDGTLVRASDFRRGMQRQLSFGANPPYYYDGILGAPECEQHPSRCDLSAGIITDDAAGTVTFRLAQADPDFLYKLALPLASPAPPAAPDHDITRAPFLPGTGPYMISQFRPGKSLTLARNPYFRQWSYAAQPAGYPDVIRYEHVTSQSAEASAVITGRADLSLPFGEDQSLAIRYPARIHVGLKLNTYYVFLNTRQPPFTNLKVRRAVNYAIDRGWLLWLFGFAPGHATATCQMLPADFPGHYSYCPYTSGAQDGSWHGPDMQTALRLVRESHTTNVPVTVWSFDTFPNKAANTYLVQLLRNLGYRATLHAVSVDQWAADMDNTRATIQMGLGEGWGADFPGPSAFFGPLLSCRSTKGPGTSNFAEFCDPRVDTLAGQAQAVQLTDPAAARKLWAQADRLVTDEAPYVPVYNATDAGFVSSRAGNYQASPVYGPLLDQMWVR